MGLFLDGVNGIFHWHNPSSRITTLGLTQPLTEMSTRNISWGVKAAGAWGWQPYQLHVPTVLKSGSLNLLEPSGPVQACNGFALPFFTVLYTLWIPFKIQFDVPSRALKSRQNSWSSSSSLGCLGRSCGCLAALLYSSCLETPPILSKKVSRPSRFSISCRSFSWNQ
jgi:hypothetical protein